MTPDVNCAICGCATLDARSDNGLGVSAFLRDKKIPVGLSLNGAADDADSA